MFFSLFFNFNFLRQYSINPKKNLFGNEKRRRSHSRKAPSRFIKDQNLFPESTLSLLGSRTRHRRLPVCFWFCDSGKRWWAKVGLAYGGRKGWLPEASPGIILTSAKPITGGPSIFLPIRRADRRPFPGAVHRGLLFLARMTSWTGIQVAPSILKSKTLSAPWMKTVWSLKNYMNIKNEKINW